MEKKIQTKYWFTYGTLIGRLSQYEERKSSHFFLSPVLARENSIIVNEM